MIKINAAAAIKEVGFADALRIANSTGTKLVWLGNESTEMIAGFLNVNSEMVIKMDPRKVYSMESKEAEELSGHVLVCYHGNTSMRVAGFLKEKHGVEAYSLSGGVTAVAGEVF
jgi:hypothetical protein